MDEKEYEFYYLLLLRSNNDLKSKNYGRIHVDSFLEFNKEQYKNVVIYSEFIKTLTPHDPFKLTKKDISSTLEIDELLSSVNGMQLRCHVNNLTAVLYKSDDKIEADWFDLYMSYVGLDEIKKAMIRI